MKTCPVCGESFGDELNFCDVDGTRLAKDGGEKDNSKIWSLLGVVLLVGALAISALSVIFLPRGRVSAPGVGSSVPQPGAPPASNPAAIETASNPPPSSSSSEPEVLVPPDSVPPELKKRDTALGPENANLSRSVKAAALAGEEGEKPAPPAEPAEPAPVTAKKSETPPAKTASDKDEAEPPRATAPPPADPKSASKSADNSNSKKKGDDKEKKKGGFFKVFKKIFGKD